MNNLLVLLMFLMMAFQSDAQNQLIGKKFKSDILIGHPKHQTNGSDINLSKIDPKLPWGYFITFHSDGSFTSYNQVSCGLDCRMKVFGSYTIASNSISIVVHEIKYYDICALQAPDKRTFTYGTFAINENGEAFILEE